MKSEIVVHEWYCRVTRAVFVSVIAASMTGCLFKEQIQLWRNGKVPSAGWIAGAGAGQSERQSYDVSPGDAVDYEDTASYVFGGYRYGNLAFAVSYSDLGDLNASGPGGGGFTDKLTSDAVAGMAILNMPVTPVVSPFLMVGMAHWTQEVRYNDSFGPFTADESGTDPAFGGGLAARFGAGPNKWMIHGFWMRYQDVGDLNNSGHQADIDMIAIGAGYMFSIP